MSGQVTTATAADSPPPDGGGDSSAPSQQSHTPSFTRECGRDSEGCWGQAKYDSSTTPPYIMPAGFDPAHVPYVDPAQEEVFGSSSPS